MTGNIFDGLLVSNSDQTPIEEILGFRGDQGSYFVWTYHNVQLFSEEFRNKGGNFWDPSLEVYPQGSMW